MSGFRRPEQPREQAVLWAQRLEDAIPQDHPVRHLDYLPRSEAFEETFRAWAGEYVLVEGKPPYHPRDLSGLYLYGMMNRIRSLRDDEPDSVEPPVGVGRSQPAGRDLADARPEAGSFDGRLVRGQTRVLVKFG